MDGKERLEAAAAEKYPITNPHTEAAYWATAKRAAYIRGRLDQAEADAQIAEGYSEEALALCSDSGWTASESWVGIQYRGMYLGAADVAIRIRKGVQ